MFRRLGSKKSQRLNGVRNQVWESGMGIRYGNQVWGGRGAGVGRMDEQAQRMSEVGERGG